MVGHFLLAKIWNPYFCSISCEIWKRLSFWTPWCSSLKQRNSHKNPCPGDSACCHPNTLIMRKAEKYIDPSRLAIPHTTLRDPVTRQPKAHTEKRAAKTWSRRSNMRTVQSRKDNPNKGHSKETKQNPPKNTKQAETHKIRKTQTENTTNPKNSNTKDKLDRKRLFAKHPNNKTTTTTTTKKQQWKPYSLKTYANKLNLANRRMGGFAFF